MQKNNTISNFDLDTTPGHPHLVPAGSEGDDRASRALMGVNYHQFAPRFGFAYALPDDKTVFRGGYGIFYSNLITLGGMQSMEVNPPNNVRVSFSTDKTKPPTILLSQGFAVERAVAGERDQRRADLLRPRLVTPMAQQCNFDIQRQLPGGVLFEVGYYGNKFDHNWRQLDGNPAPPEPGNINANRPFTSTVVPGTGATITLADVVRIQKDGYSNYNALQAKVEKRYAKGLTFIASYSYLEDDGDRRYVGRSERAELGGGTRGFEPGCDATFCGQRGLFAAVRQRTCAWSELGPRDQRHSGRLERGADRHGQHGLAAEPERQRRASQYGRRGPAECGGRLAPGQSDGSAVVQHGGIRGECSLHVRQCGAQYSARTGSVQSGSGRAQDIPDYGARDGAVAAGVVQRDQYAGLGNPNTQVGNALFGQISSAGTPRDNQIGLKILF